MGAPVFTKGKMKTTKKQLYNGQFVWSQKCQKSYIPYLYNTDTFKEDNWLCPFGVRIKEVWLYLDYGQPSDTKSQVTCRLSVQKQSLSSNVICFC